MFVIGLERVGIFGAGDDGIAHDAVINSEAERAVSVALTRILGDVSLDTYFDFVDPTKKMQRLVGHIEGLSDRELLALTLHFGNVGERVLIARLNQALNDPSSSSG